MCLKFYSIVTQCNSLEELDVSGCFLVTNGTVLTSIETAKMESRCKKLRLIVGGTYSFDHFKSLLLLIIVKIECVKCGVVTANGR